MVTSPEILRSWQPPEDNQVHPHSAPSYKNRRVCSENSEGARLWKLALIKRQAVSGKAGARSRPGQRGAGEKGGRIVAAGPPRELVRSRASRTALPGALGGPVGRAYGQ